MFLMGIFWYHLYDMSNYKLCNLDTYNHNFGSSVKPFLRKVLQTASSDFMLWETAHVR